MFVKRFHCFTVFWLLQRGAYCYESQNVCQEVSLYSGCCRGRGVLTAMSHRMFVKRFHCILAVAEGCLLL